MEGLEQVISQVISGIYHDGMPYPSKVVTNLEPLRDPQPLLGPPLMEISVVTDNGRFGNQYDLLVTHVIHSPLLRSYWFVYGCINETLITGKPEDIQVLTFRWFQQRGYISPFRLWSCQYLECRLLNIREIESALMDMPAVTAYRILT